MAGGYHDGSRELQDRFDTRRLADRLHERVVRQTILPEDRAFIERMDMFFLGTADDAGQPQCSYIQRMALVERSPYVPRRGVPTPELDREHGDLVTGALPADDPAAEPLAT